MDSNNLNGDDSTANFNNQQYMTSDPQSYVHQDDNYNNNYFEQSPYQQQQQFQYYDDGNDDQQNNPGKNNYFNHDQSQTDQFANNKQNTDSQVQMNYFQQDNLLDDFSHQNNNNNYNQKQVYLNDNNDHNGKNSNYQDIDLIQNNNNNNNFQDNIFESKKDLHDNNRIHSKDQTINKNMKFIDVSNDEELNKRMENVLDNFNNDDDDNPIDYNNINDYAYMNSYKSNKMSRKKLHDNTTMAMTLDKSPSNMRNLVNKQEIVDQKAANTIQHNQDNQIKILYESQDVEARNNYVISDNEQLQNDKNQNTNDVKIKMNQNIDMKMFKQQQQPKVKKSLKKQLKQGVNMQDTINNNNNDTKIQEQQKQLTDTYKPPKKGKNKKDRGQEIVLDTDNNDNDDNSALDNSPGDDNSVNNQGNIEFYNRSPRIGYETNEDDKQQQQQQQPKIQIILNTQDNSLERDENDEDNIGSDYIDLKADKSKTKSGKKISKSKIMKNKANKEYLEQLKHKNKNSTMNNNDSLKEYNGEYDNNLELDDYTKEYLRQKKNKESLKSTRRLGQTLNNDSDATQQYGLQNVSVAQVMETTRKTHRSNRTHRGGQANNLELTTHQKNTPYQEQDSMSKTLGKTGLMGTIVDNSKFNIGEIEYKDKEERQRKEFEIRSQQLGATLNRNNAIPKKDDIGGPLAQHEINEVEYKQRRKRRNNNGSMDYEYDENNHKDNFSNNQSDNDDAQDRKRYKLMNHLQLPMVLSALNNDQFDNQVNNSYLVTNENQRILESQEDVRMSQMLNNYNEGRNNDEDFEDVNLNRPLGKPSQIHSRQQSSVNVSLQNSQKIKNEASQQFNQLNYDLSKAINEARLKESQQSQTTIEPFLNEHFKTLILNTYDDWYSDISIRWDINDYLEVLEKSQLEEHFSKYLEQNGLNVLTLQNMPFVDLGDRPSTYNPRKPEAEQIYVMPSSQYPNKLIIKYADCKPVYGIKFIEDKYAKCKLKDKGVSLEDLQNCILNASIFLRPYRGAVTRLDRINLINILVGLAITIALSMSIGITIHWAFSLIFIVVYFIFAAISIRITKKKSNRFMRQAHFMLAIYCRAENNRYFLKKNIEMRPGFLARWIEFNIYHPQQNQQLDKQLQQNDIENPITLEQQEQQDGPEQVIDFTSPEYLEKMRDRWENQKSMKQINLFGADGNKDKKNPPIPIKDIEQYKNDQQLAMLLQEQESGKYEDQFNQDYEESKDEINHDFEQINHYNSNLNNYQTKDKLRKILPPINEMGGISEDQIYSGFYDKSKSIQNKNKIKMPPIQNQGKMHSSGLNQHQQFFSPNNKFKTQHGSDDHYYDDENESVQSSMKKLTKSYYNMAAVPQQAARKGSALINPMLMHKQSDDYSSHQQQQYYQDDHEEEIKEEDDHQYDDNEYRQPQQQQIHIQQQDYDDEYDDEEGDGAEEYKQYKFNPQSYNKQNSQNLRQSVQSNNKLIINNHQSKNSQQNNKQQQIQNTKASVPPKQTKKFQEESYHQDDDYMDDDDDY